MGEGGGERGLSDDNTKIPTLRFRTMVLRLRVMTLFKSYIWKPVYLPDICFEYNHYSFRYTRMADIPRVLTQALFVPVKRTCGTLFLNISERFTMSMTLKAYWLCSERNE